MEQNIKLYFRGRGGRKVFPIGGNDKETEIKVIGTTNIKRSTDQIIVAGNLDLQGRHESACRVYDPQGIAPAQNTCGGGGLETKILVPEYIPSPSDINRTLRVGGWDTPTAKHNFNIINDGRRIRKLTPKECFRLQGFPDEYFERAREVNSDSQLYKQAGNSVTVTVIYEIARRF